MGGKAIIVVGATGRGKSTWTRKRLEQVNKNALMIYDVNAEHTDLYPKPFAEDFEDFLDATTKVKNAVIMYEEATMFFSNKSSGQKMKSILVRKRHANNTIFMLFHSLRMVPLDIIDLCTHIVLFKTNDMLPAVERRFKNMDDIINLYQRVNNHKDFHYHEIYSIY